MNLTLVDRSTRGDNITNYCRKRDSLKKLSPLSNALQVKVCPCAVDTTASKSHNIDREQSTMISSRTFPAAFGQTKSYSATNDVSGSRKPQPTSTQPEPLHPSLKAVQYPDSMKHLPRLTPQSFRQQFRDQGLEGIFVDFVSLDSLGGDPGNRLREHLKKSGMARYVDGVVPGDGGFGLRN
ncbi:hypothetical protein AUEXF2481DRAFT_40640 [Aureobasidium subglaciale EXF-2481]|uniref:Uncharacterized protein n=1 Tax=Aureobasidium subglaciale (strain EXF-2481) TaxID=1043005 RepID=A0A074Z751_AURSE|nr:uncharacterized protein AUEXF2481DRAFT_40640 [Aureobasidium subglaciale EXF-2481]KEQ94706.1 hypothetical protein AUEXF2481DRAFT_40640 [Aureobasidium subglaciale EXF-2481]